MSEPTPQTPQSRIVWGVAQALIVVAIGGLITSGITTHDDVLKMQIKQDAMVQKLKEQGDVKTDLALIKAQLKYMGTTLEKLEKKSGTK